MIGAFLSACQDNRVNPKIQATVAAVAGHTHVLNVRYQDVENGRDSYVLEEAAGHHHEIQLSPENRSLLLIRMPVTVTSSEAAGHTHSVSLTVADS